MRAGSTGRESASPYFQDVGVDAPVRALPDAARVVVDQDSLAEAAGLVGRDVERPQHLAVPRGLGIELEPERRAGVARQHRVVAVPDGLEPEVVVRPAVRQEEPLPVCDLVEEIGALDPLERRRIHLDHDRRQERREGARRGDGERDRERRVPDQPDPVVAGVRLGEAEAHPRGEVGRVEDEARPIREAPGAWSCRRGAPRTPPGAGRSAVARAGGRPARSRARRPSGGRTPGAADDELPEILRDVALEAERVPPGGEHAGGDRAAGDARDAVQSGQEAQLVESAERAAMEQRRAEPPAREGEADARLDSFDSERHAAPPAEPLRHLMRGLAIDRATRVPRHRIGARFAGMRG